MHSLQNFLFIANERHIRKRNHEDQLNQAAFLNLVVNAVTVWNTVYLRAALEQLRSEGCKIDEDDVKHLSPARSEHINIYGRYYFNIEEGLKGKGLREIRKPKKELWRKLAKPTSLKISPLISLPVISRQADCRICRVFSMLAFHKFNACRVSIRRRC